MAKKFSANQIRSYLSQMDEDEHDDLTLIQDMVYANPLYYDEMNCYVDLGSKHKERILVASSESLENWIKYEFFKTHTRYPQQTDLKNFISTLDLHIQQNGKKIKLHNRYVCQDDAVFIDLGTPEFECAKVDRTGVSIVPPSSLVFYRNPSIAPFKLANYPGEMDDFWNLINVKNEHDRTLLFAWLTCQFLANVEKPLLLLLGPQGSGKTTAARFLRALVDPADPIDVHLDDKDDEFAFNMYKNPVPYFDNVGRLSAKHCDKFCRAITKTVFMKRALYTNNKQICYEYQRSFIMTAVQMPFKAEDLMSRTISVNFAPIAAPNYAEKNDLIQRFEMIAPGVRRHILENLVEAFKIRKHINLKIKTRFAEFDSWATSITIAHTEQVNDFMAARISNILKLTIGPMAETVVTGITCILAEPKEWVGTASELLGLLSSLDYINHSFLPHSDVKLGILLGKLAAQSSYTRIHIEKKLVRGTSQYKLSLLEQVDFTECTFPTKRDICNGCRYSDSSEHTERCTMSRLNSAEMKSILPSCSMKSTDAQADDESYETGGDFEEINYDSDYTDISNNKIIF